MKIGDIKSIELDEKQTAVQKNLIEGIVMIESQMLSVVDSKQPEMVTELLASALSLLGTTGRIMEKAKMIHDWSLGQAAIEVMNNDLLRDSKQQILTAYLKGRCAKYSGLYERAHQACTKLDTYVMGCQSILKIATEEMRLSRFAPQ